MCLALVVAPPISSGSVEALPLHLAGDVHHFVEARRDQAAEADHVDPFLDGRFQNLFAGDHHAQVDHLVVVAAEHDADDVLADVVDVALDGRHAGSCRAACRPRRLAAFSASMNGSR